MLVLAGAGTGKTTTLSARVGWLIEHGVAPERVLLLTFTRRAAREMLGRVRSMVGVGERETPLDGSIGVLICDDVESMRVLLGVVVGLRAGLHVVGEAKDGEQAISEAERLQPDVILLDISMPIRSGLDALPEIKRVAPEAKVIVLTGFAASMIAPDVLALGADRFIEKGVDPDTIAAAIEEVAAAPILAV